MSEMEFIGKETSKMWMSEFSSIYNSQCYSAAANFFHTHSYDELKPNDKNFQIALSAGYTKGGIDFSKFVDLSEIQCKNSTILETDKDIEKGLARKACSIMQEHINVTEPQKFETNLGIIRTDLSFEQQLQLEMVRVFMDRVKEDYNTFLSNHNISSHQLKEKQKKEILTSIINNERMASGYDTHSNKFTEKLLTSNITPKKNNKLFNNELESLTTIDGVNIHKELKRYCILDELNSKTNDNAIFIGYSNNNELLKDYDKKSPANREKLKKQYFNTKEDIALRIKEQQRQQHEEQARNEAKRQNTFTNSEDRKATQNQELYYGTPIYDENSTIETREIIDFSKPFLLRQYQAMCVLEKINPQTTKSTTQNQTQETSPSTINYALISQSQNSK
ncbi:MAG: hypothetical protein IJZ30_05780 [Alphaproteobacteria bacterium]|nr:hypothetical protein [Alphaproteobacteria bacterium]